MSSLSLGIKPMWLYVRNGLEAITVYWLREPPEFKKHSKKKKRNKKRNSVEDGDKYTVSYYTQQPTAH